MVMLCGSGAGNVVMLYDNVMWCGNVVWQCGVVW